MKKILLTLAAVLCCAFTLATVTSCKKEEEAPKTGTYEYTFGHEVISFTAFGDYRAAENAWIESIKACYKASLGVTSDVFSLEGTVNECDQKVRDACKRAEPAVDQIHGGSLNIYIKNKTTNNQVYSYQAN